MKKKCPCYLLSNFTATYKFYQKYIVAKHSFTIIQYAILTNNCCMRAMNELTALLPIGHKFGKNWKSLISNNSKDNFEKFLLCYFY